ncbi:hypothetical protein EJF36_19485 [Bacillus sp. HMF5848]|uniref:hypothetical protein n=1 Tax=Bacillus sp. HMF5848 TaxID=2495421 RepID=UPI000F7AD993|nr:hypothetical protein [Bacillus sp. HMF5848]RSK28882.1 hypothetical protein EJF36_19485 [Bacillus sp. HMF5848]
MIEERIDRIERLVLDLLCKVAKTHEKLIDLETQLVQAIEEVAEETSQSERLGKLQEQLTSLESSMYDLHATTFTKIS